MPPTDDKVTPTPDQIAQTSEAEALAADLRALAAMVAAHPEVAAIVGDQLDHLQAITNPGRTGVYPGNVVAAALEQGAVETTTPGDIVFPGKTVEFPHGAIRLTTSWLDTAGIRPAESLGRAPSSLFDPYGTVIPNGSS